MRNAFLGMIVVVFACSGAIAGPSEGALLSGDESRDVDAVIASMVGAGFPNARNATVYSGKVSVSATFDPGKGPPPLPSAASRTQMTAPNSTKMTYGYVLEGLHFKLPDGSWIISLSYHFTPRPGDSVDVKDATEVKLATMMADAAAAHPFDAEKRAGKWLDGVPPGQRARSAAVMNRLVPITMYLKLSPDIVAPAVVMLHEAGWTEADELSLVIADQRARNYWQLRPWTNADVAFDPSGAYPGAVDEEKAWKASHATFAPEPPAVALRRALFRWCRAQMMVEEPEDAMLSLAVAAAAAKAAVDPKDPQNNAARIDLLAAAAKLPVTVAKDADLTARLQSWELRPRMPRMTVSGNGNGGPSISTSFLAPPSAYEPAKSDIDALVAALNDPRPSRFFDFSGARPVGDNAWRAVTTLLKADPRTLAGYPTDHAWTSEERKAAAAAVQAWWKAHRKEYADK